MKRIVAAILLSVITVFGYAQERVKFLGIPVDGTFSSMSYKLRQKGFKQVGDHLEGEYKGEPVNVFIHTTNGNVDRIIAAYKESLSKYGIYKEFNALKENYDKDEKFLLIKGDAISEDENISYEMRVHNKLYACSYILNPFIMDENDEFTDYAKDLINRSIEEVDELIKNGDVKEKDRDEKITLHAVDKAISERSGIVGFAISDEGGGRYIIMYYFNNEKNRQKNDN